MANYNGRRGLNFSQYLENLNAIPTGMDVQDEPFDIDAELALFTNTEFIDFENMATVRPAPADFGGFDAQTKGLDMVMDGTATPRAAEINEMNRQNATVGAAPSVATDAKAMEVDANGESTTLLSSFIIDILDMYWTFISSCHFLHCSAHPPPPALYHHGLGVWLSVGLCPTGQFHLFQPQGVRPGGPLGGCG